MKCVPMLAGSDNYDGPMIVVVAIVEDYTSTKRVKWLLFLLLYLVAVHGVILSI